MFLNITKLKHKMKLKLNLVIFSFFLSMMFVSASTCPDNIGVCNPDLPFQSYATPTSLGGSINNYYTGSSFNATYDTWLPNYTLSNKWWYNQTIADSSKLNLSGTNANQNINITPWNITATEGIFYNLTDTSLADEQVLFSKNGKIIGSNNLRFDGTSFSIGNIATSWLFAVKGTAGLIFSDLGTSMDFVGYTGASYNKMVFRSGTVRSLIISTNGKVGIITETPTETLDVTGNITVSGIGKFVNLNVSGNISTPNSCGCGWEKGDFKMSNTTTETTCWQVADGTGGTADLRDRFIVGAGTIYAVNEMGGSTSTGTGYAAIPAHLHNIGKSTSTYGVYEGTESVVTSVNSETDEAGDTDDGHDHTGTIPPYYALVYKQCIC